MEVREECWKPEDLSKAHWSVQGRDDSGSGPDGGSRCGGKLQALKSHIEVEITNTAEGRVEGGWGGTMAKRCL